MAASIIDHLVRCGNCGYVFYSKVKRICPGCSDCYVDPRDRASECDKQLYLEQNPPEAFLQNLFVRFIDV